jgi:esterase/lipase superfamily enzyme/outer membrane protein OmpA-like peptidoglycan-associated protein
MRTSASRMGWVLLLCAQLGAGCSSIGMKPAPEKVPAPAPVAAPPAAPSPPPAERPVTPPPPPQVPLPVLEKVTFARDAFFAPRSTTLTPESVAKLSDVTLRASGINLEVVVAVGHADGTETPSDAAAQTLSMARADAVKAYLVAQGFEGNRVYTEGQGRRQPVASNAEAQGRAKNRRVEIEVIGTRVANARAPERTQPREHVPVLFGTTRARTGQNDPRVYFGSAEDETLPDDRVTLGRVTVRVPPGHKSGVMKEPGFIRVVLERVSSSTPASTLGIKPVSGANLDTDFSFVGPVEEFAATLFGAELRATLARSMTHSALVYVHGFADNFQYGAFRAAQFAYDLREGDYDVVPVLYSWPSDPSHFNYLGAGDRVPSAGRHLAGFLDMVATVAGTGVVHVVAHSKGAQVLTEALNMMRTGNLTAIGPDGKTLVPRFNQIVLAAPDIRAHDFQSVIVPAVVSAHGVTNYVASNDTALRAAKKANAGARAGDAAPTPVVVPGVETVDITRVNTSNVGHAGFAESQRVIEDIRALFRGEGPSERHLRRVPRQEMGYWQLLQ